MAGALSVASSISAGAQSVQGQYGGGFSLKLPLGDSGGRPAIRPWAHGDGATGSTSAFVGSDYSTGSNAGSTSSGNGVGSGAAGGALGAVGSAGAGGGAALSGVKRP